MTGRRRIGAQQIRALQPGQTIWDSSVTGFGARRQRSEAVAYILQYRTREGRSRLYTIGRHGAPWTPDNAREEARRLLGQVAAGDDPATAKQSARHAQSVSELCDLYLADVEAGRLLTRRQRPKKNSTVSTDRGRITRHIKPLLGRLAVSGVTRTDVEAFMHDVAEGKTACREKTRARGLANVRGGKGTASRTVGLLGAIFTYAVRRGMRPDNPVHGVTRFADGRRDRRVSETEYELLGATLRDAESDLAWPPLIGAVRFLALTGWRRGEVLGLSWREIDLERRTARLTDTKTGASTRPLSRRACAVLRSMSRNGELVFAATRGQRIMTGFNKMWIRLFGDSGLPSDVTPHILRHSFASLGSDLGYSDATVGAVIGHKGHTVTSRYVHAADTHLLAAADKVADEISRLMGDSVPVAEVVPLRLAQRN